MSHRFLRTETTPLASLTRIILCLNTIVVLSAMLYSNMALGADITLQWEASGGASGYVLHYGNQSRSYDTVVDVGPKVQHTVSDLQENKSYFFAVTAYCDTDESEYSAELRHDIIANQPPTANAGPDKAVQENTTVILNGKDSYDPDDGIKELYWEQVSGPQVQLSGASEDSCQFTAPSVDSGTESLIFKIVVQDYSDRVSTDTCTIAVADVSDEASPDEDGDIETPTDKIAISKAIYNSRKDKLELIAKSTDGSTGAVLTAWAETNGQRIKLGDLRFRSRRGYYLSVFRNLDQAPDRIIVSSSSGGETSISCDIRR